MNLELAKRMVAAEITAATRLGAFSDSFRLVRYSFPEIWVEVDSVKRERLFILRVRVDDYDAQPPEIRVVRPDGTNVIAAEHPLRNDGPFPSHAAAGLPQFLCIDGTRDYYTHESHRPQQTGVSWEHQRADRPLSTLLLTTAHKFRTGEWA